MNATTKATRTAEQTAAIKADLKRQREMREGAATIELKIADSAPQVEDELSQAEQLKQAAMAAIAKLFGIDEDAPSWKRKLAAFFASTVLAFGAGYLIGTLAGYAILGIAMLGGSVLWSYLIMLGAIMLSMYAGLKIGQYVGNYVLSGQVDKDLARVKDAAKNVGAKLTGFFKRSSDATETVAPVAA